MQTDTGCHLWTDSFCAWALLNDKLAHVRLRSHTVSAGTCHLTLICCRTNQHITLQTSAVHCEITVWPVRLSYQTTTGFNVLDLNAMFAACTCDNAEHIAGCVS